VTAPAATEQSEQSEQSERTGRTGLARGEQQSLETMVRAMCAAADAGDGQAFAAYFAETARFRFGNNEPIEGPAAIAKSTEGTVDAIWPVRHRVDQVAQVGPQLFCRFTISVTRPDGAEIAMPCVTVIELREDGLITDYAVHMDISPALR
jgi:ketosteroid isomerase-like protein